MVDEECDRLLLAVNTYDAINIASSSQKLISTIEYIEKCGCANLIEDKISNIWNIIGAGQNILYENKDMDIDVNLNDDCNI